LGAATSNTSVVFANHYLIDEHGRRLEAESLECTRIYARDQLCAGAVADAAAVVWRNSVPICASLIRTADVRRLRFKEDLNTPEIELFIRLANEEHAFAFVPEYLSEYRTHPHSATAAGLRSERLAPYLLPMPAAPHVEQYKRRFMASLLADAVSRALQRGDREAARGFLRSDYYPWLRPARNGGGVVKDLLRGGVQGVCAWLPSSIGCPAYRALRRVKAGVLR
jgi:hypothetical protein